MIEKLSDNKTTATAALPVSCRGIEVPLARAVRLLPDPRSIIHFSRRQCCHTVGAMFWFNRNRLVGSYSFFSSTSRRYVSAGYDARTSAVFASPVKFT